MGLSHTTGSPSDTASRTSGTCLSSGGRGRDGVRPGGGELGALAAHAQDPVAVFLTEIGDVRSSGFEDPQAQPEHGHQREIARVRRFPGSGEQCLELQVGEPQGG